MLRLRAAASAHFPSPCWFQSPSLRKPPRSCRDPIFDRHSTISTARIIFVASCTAAARFFVSVAAVGNREVSLCKDETRPRPQSASLANRTAVAKPGRTATKIFSGCGNITTTAVQMRSVVLGPRTQLLAAARAPIPQRTPGGAAEVQLRRGCVHVLIR